jgi:hypothetical protein
MISRRAFLGQAVAGAALLGAPPEARKKVAALSTVYHVRSHTDNFVTRFLEGYWINEKYYAPPSFSMPRSPAASTFAPDAPKMFATRCCA